MINSQLLRNIWPVNRVIAEFKNGYPEDYQKAGSLCHILVKNAIEEIRNKIAAGDLDYLPELETFTGQIKAKLDNQLSNTLRTVINATGIIINTNLGRAPLSEKILDYLKDCAVTYSNLEYNLEEGKRGSRQEHTEAILQELTGAEAALAVNNNAAAVFLVCNTFAANREIIVSRGELIEIGGSFRLPEIIGQSSARLKEVGTTNKTYLSDYQQAIGPDTGIIMKSHTSNYKITGFTGQVSSAGLVSLARENNLISFEDIGSGLLIRPEIIGLSDEPYILDKVNEGLDLICFSGDKLLGGPQAGIILGKKALIEKLQVNPLARIMRIDKLSLAALEATLRLYFLDSASLISEIPVLQMISLSYDEIMNLTLALVNQLKNLKAEIEITEGYSLPGGGSFPAGDILTPVIALTPLEKPVNVLATELRKNNPPLIGKTEKNRFLINLRTVRKNQLSEVIKALQDKLQ
jgi:L-seryl-tRNA(Ser) seleniumtransferase